MKKARRLIRGQTLPLWTLGLITCLTLALFLVNYANQVRWQIRAQNAADAVAGASIAPVANFNNQLMMVFYAMSLDEMRIRYLNQAVINNLNGYGCSAHCDQDYDDLVNELNAAIHDYDRAFSQMLNKLGNPATDKFQDTASGAFETASGISGKDRFKDCGGNNQYPCSTFAADQAFTFTALDSAFANMGLGTNNSVDVVACKNVPMLITGLLGLKSNWQFKAIARSAFTVVPVPETFSPHNPNPQASNAPFQPNENWLTNYPAESSSLNLVDFSTLSLNLNFYVPGPVRPYTSFNPNPAPTATPVPCS